MADGAPLRLYDTARQAVVPFEPGPVVTMYTCGITPYDATHIGHAATYLTYDVLQRRLRDRGHETRCVRNITDVDDDLLRKARELGVHYLDLAAGEIARFDDDIAALGLLPSWSEPRATSAIADIRGFIGMVLDRGHAYEAGGAVYFDVSSWPRFGEISHYDRDEMLRLAAERGGNPDDPNKRDPLDFVLWQPSADDEPSWETIWGPGRPGWHIECSALALRELGTTIDLHGGGSDLIFPHHECESAQSEAATGEPFVRHWMHQAMVRMDGEKMSKSLGNLVFVSELRKEWDTRAIRLAAVANHYRTAWEWNDDRMPEADARLRSWLAGGAGDLEEAREAGGETGGGEAEDDQPAGIDAREPRCPWRLPGEPDLKAEPVAGEQHIGDDHREEGEEHAPMHARAFDDVGVVTRRIILEIARSGEAAALGVLQQAEAHRGEKLFGDIDQHQRDEDLVGTEFHLEKRRYHGPDHTADGTRDDHQRKDIPGIEGIEGEAHAGAADRAHDVLPFGADVPDTGAEAEAEADGDEDERPGLDQQLRARIGGELFTEQRIPEDQLDRLERVFAQDHEQHPARDHRQQHRKHGGGIVPGL